MKKAVFILALIFTVVVLGSCQKEKDEVIVFDETYPLALAPDISWAVVTDPYAAYKKNPEWTAEAMSYCRKGEILQVIGKSVDSKNENWYYFENGWLPENSLAIYSNRLKAKTAVEQLGD